MIQNLFPKDMCKSLPCGNSGFSALLPLLLWVPLQSLRRNTTPGSTQYFYCSCYGFWVFPLRCTISCWMGVNKLMTWDLEIIHAFHFFHNSFTSLCSFSHIISILWILNTFHFLKMRLLLLFLILLLPDMIFKRRMEQDHFFHHLNIGSQHIHLDLCVYVLLLNCIQLLATPWTVACQVSLSMGFPRQEYWSLLPCPPLGDLPEPEIEPTCPALAGGFFT